MCSTSEKTFSRFVSGSRVVFLGLIIRSAILFVCEILLARWLGPSQYGSITFAISIINLSSIISGFGLNTASRRYIPIYIAHPDRGSLFAFVRFSRLVTLILAFAILILLIGFMQLDLIRLEFTERQLVTLLALAIPFWSLQKLFLGMAAGLKYTGIKVLVEDIFVPCGFLLVIALVYAMSLGVVAIVLGYVLVFALSAVLVGSAIWRHPKILEARRANQHLAKGEVLKFSWPLLVTEVLGKATGMLEFIIIGMVATTTELGFYRPASDLAITMSIILMGFSFLYLPVISEYFAKSQAAAWQQFNASVARLTMFLSFPIFALLFFYPTEVLKLFYGQEYMVASEALRVLSVTYFFHAAVGFTGMNLIAAGYTRTQLLAKLAALSGLVISSIILIPQFGILGAAYATLLGFVLSNGLNLLASFYYMRLHPFNLKYLVALGVLLGVALLLDLTVATLDVSGSLRLLCFAVLLVVCVVLFFFTGILFDRVDRDSILNLVKLQFSR